MKYKGYYIVDMHYSTYGNSIDKIKYLVKDDPDNRNSLHHGSFDTQKIAKRFIDTIVDEIKEHDK